jgi:hypothetical protein
MTWPASPAWLLELQAKFGALLQTPLGRETGELRAVTSAYDARLVSEAKPGRGGGARERLAVYHRQYWFRLFTVLQGAYPLTARVLGFWRFNAFATEHLLRRPPRGFDLDTVADGLDALLAELLSDVPRVDIDRRRSIDARAVVEAARIDAAFQRVLRAPRVPSFAPGPADVARLPTSRLALSPCVALVHERWPLCELRTKLQDSKDEQPVTLPEPLPSERVSLLLRQGLQLGLITLEPREAELLELLAQLSVSEALAGLEQRTPPAEREGLPPRAQAWLAKSVRLGVWHGFVDAQK